MEFTPLRRDPKARNLHARLPSLHLDTALSRPPLGFPVAHHLLLILAAGEIPQELGSLWVPGPFDNRMKSTYEARTHKRVSLSLSEITSRQF